MFRQTSFDQRVVRYEEVHAIHPDDFRAFVDMTGVMDTHSKVLDCGCGYGAITRELLRATEHSRTQGNTRLTIDLIDESAIQLSRARMELQQWLSSRNATLSFIEGVFPDDLENGRTYDVIACKMVLHEVDRGQQPSFVDGLYQSLTPQGRLLLWDICLSADVADFFRAIVRRKDQLLGFDSMVQRRSFLTEEDLMNLFRRSSFERVQLARDILYRFDTSRRFLTEFRADREKFELWTDFVRERAANLPTSVRAYLHYSDCSAGISFDIRKVIAVAQRVEMASRKSKLAGATN